MQFLLRGSLDTNIIFKCLRKFRIAYNLFKSIIKKVPNFNINILDNKKQTLLINGIINHNNINIIKYLLKHGINIHIRNVENKSAIMYAIRYGNIKVVNLLLKYGANIKDLSSYKDTGSLYSHIIKVLNMKIKELREVKKILTENDIVRANVMKMI